MSEAQKPKRRLRIAAIVLAVVLLVPVAAGAALLASFDADHYKPQIVAAIRRATGRDVSLNGAVRVMLNPRLVLEAADASLGNLPNGTRPDMATTQRVEAEVALIPLLHGKLEITKLVLIRPNLLLETDAEGNPNWLFHHPEGNQGPAVANAVAKRIHRGHLDIQSVRITDGTLTWHDGQSGETRVLRVDEFEVSERSESAPISFAGRLGYTGIDIAVSGQLGSLARLRDEGATTPWPVRLALASEGGELNAEGSFSDPLHARGYALKIAGKLPDLGRLASVTRGGVLPPFRDVDFRLELNDIGAAWPEPSAILLHAGPSDLGAVVPGLEIDKLDVSAPRFDQPVQVAVDGVYANTPLKLAANLGAPVALIPGLSGSPFPVEIAAEAAGASFNAKGGIATPSQTAGLDVKLSARIPDLAAFSPLVRRALPRLKDIAFDGELVDRNASWLEGMVLKGIRLTFPEADITGDAVLGLTSERPMLHATLSSSRIDADAITAAMSPAHSPGDVQPTPASTEPGARAAAPGAHPAQPISMPDPAHADPPAPNARRTLMFSDQRLPLDRIRKADGDLRMTVGLLHSGGADFRNIVAHFRLTNGHVHVGPLEGQLPDGPFTFYFDFNPNQPAWPVVFTAHATGLPLQPVLTLLRLPDAAQGTIQIDSDLKSAGSSLHEIASGLTGHFGLSLQNGAVDNRLLSGMLDPLLRDAKLPSAVGTSGKTDVRCFAMRADANRGAVGLRAFVLDASHVHLSAVGSIDLPGETLDLHARPMLKLGASGVVVPVQIEGAMLAPRAQVDAGTAALASALLGQLSGQAGAEPERASGTADATNCDAALALARGEGAEDTAASSAAPAKPAARSSRRLSGRELLRRLH